MKKAVIFDMDGLMINSERVTFEGYQLVMGKLGLSISEDFYKQLLGKTLPTAYQIFYNEYGPSLKWRSSIYGWPFWSGRYPIKKRIIGTFNIFERK